MSSTVYRLHLRLCVSKTKMSKVFAHCKKCFVFRFFFSSRFFPLLFVSALNSWDELFNSVLFFLNETKPRARTQRQESMKIFYWMLKAFLITAAHEKFIVNTKSGDRSKFSFDAISFIASKIKFFVWICFLFFVHYFIVYRAHTL